MLAQLSLPFAIQIIADFMENYEQVKGWRVINYVYFLLGHAKGRAMADPAWVSRLRVMAA